MKKNKKKAFTLVELLAVIVILAVVLVIAIPQIMNTIRTSRLKTMEGSAKLIASKAEKEFVENNMNKTDRDYQVINCNEIVKISSDEYSRCLVEVSPDGEAYINLKGTKNGKFKGMVCAGTIENMDCRHGESSSESIYALGIPQVTNLTYEINYDKCMEANNILVAELSASDKELYCTDKETSDGYSIKEDLKDPGARENLINEGIVTNVNAEYEQITDYNSLNSNVFIKWPKGESKYDNLTSKSVCIKYQGNTNNEINCFEYDNYEYEKQHLADVFGKDKCTGNDVDSLALKDSFLNKILGIENVYADQESYEVQVPIGEIIQVKTVKATDGMYECELNEFGYVSCTYDGEGYKVNSMGGVSEHTKFGEAVIPWIPEQKMEK